MTFKQGEINVEKMGLTPPWTPTGVKNGAHPNNLSKDRNLLKSYSVISVTEWSTFDFGFVLCFNFVQPSALLSSKSPPIWKKGINSSKIEIFWDIWNPCPDPSKWQFKRRRTLVTCLTFPFLSSLLLCRMLISPIVTLFLMFKKASLTNF